ncbi:MAG: TIGR03088 family PEP-CTERM/XrtA system glycosyltransferase [Rhodoferax sp.]|nr:TIGR03088 family PEP-CTERM/XrtA system glycosyltransferase [Rhodoferax sp.]
MLGDTRPLVLHVMYRFDTGGLENGVVNLINHMPADAYRHAVLALTEVTDFSQRVQRKDVEFIALHKPPGHGIWQYPKLFRLFRRLRPHIVHSRNLAALEVQVPAWAAGVPVRIHGEHGRDVGDLDGSNVTYQRMRRVYKPFVHRYIALSRDLDDYLVQKVHVPQGKITQAYNGVDTDRFCPAPDGPLTIAGCPFDPAQHWLVGTVGRMQTVKDQTLLARAFVQALQTDPSLKQRLRLVMVGEGPLRAKAQGILEAAGVADLAWLPGERSDVADVMRGLHAFALPSLAEGISNTILEAMASGLPVIATAVGGNADLVHQPDTGVVVPAANVEAMARELVRLANDQERCLKMGHAGRQRVLDRFSMNAMVSTYQNVYDSQLRASLS